MKKLLFLCIILCNQLTSSGFDTIEVLTLGKGNPLVIIPGLGGANVWRRSIDQLATKNRCHIISVKGLDGGKSKSVLDIGSVVDEIAKYIETEGLKNPVLMAHSFGGFIAMQLLSQRPGIFSKLILIDSYPFSLALLNSTITQDVGAQQSVMFKNQISALPEPGYLGYWQQNVKEMVTDTVSQKQFLKDLLQSEKTNLIDAQCAMLSNDLRPILSKIKCPALVLASAAVYRKLGLDINTINQRITDQFANLSNCNIFIHESAKHFIMIDDASWFWGHVNQFLM